MNKYIDLHIHTTSSDGIYTTEQIVKRATEEQLGIIAITDHNTASGLKEIEKYENGDMIIIRGVELTAFDKEERHILGYFTNDVSDKIDTFIKNKRRDYTKKFTMCYRNLVKKGIKVGLQDITDNGIYSAKKTCRSLLNKGYTKTEERHILGYFTNDVSDKIDTFIKNKRRDYTKKFTMCYRNLVKKGIKVGLQDITDNGIYSAKKTCRSLLNKGYTKTEEEAYMLMFGYGKAEYRCLWQASSKECIEFINKIGGVAVLAHPGHYRKKVKEREIIELIEYGLRGVECYYPSHTQGEVEYYLNICKKKEMLITGGSDFHGDVNHPQMLGMLHLEKEKCCQFLSFFNKIV